MAARSLSIVAVLAVGFLLWSRTAAPVGWTSLWVGALLLAFGVHHWQRTSAKVLLNVGSLLAVLGILEVHQWAKHETPTQHRPERFTHAYVGEDEVLGYATRPDRSGTDELWLGDERIYRVEYTIDADGVRVAPPPGEVPPEAAVLCFGGSFMFGEGLANEETVRWRAQEELGGRYRFYNFGLHGYGPHQMLALLESGRVAAAADERPEFAIYWAIQDHARRAAGKTSWDHRGPLYEVDEGARPCAPAPSPISPGPRSRNRARCPGSLASRGSSARRYRPTSRSRRATFSGGPGSCARPDSGWRRGSRGASST